MYFTHYTHQDKDIPTEFKLDSIVSNMKPLIILRIKVGRTVTAIHIGDNKNLEDLKLEIDKWIHNHIMDS